MIQRIQTVYLSFVVILMILTYFFDHAVFSLEGVDIYTFSVDKLTTLSDGTSIQAGNWMAQIGLMSLVSIIAIMAIASFKNRKRQLQLGKINYLLLIAFILSDYFSIKNMPMLMPEGEELATLYTFGFYFPIAALTFQFLANRGIKKDEELVRSVERLR